MARAKPSGVTWKQGDIAALPVPDGAFDIVVNALVMEHVADIRPALAEAERVLAPGGAFVMSVYMAAEYVTEVLALGMRLTHLLEPLVDDALVARLPKSEKHRGTPAAIILRAEKGV